jgi:cytochrome P450
VTVAMEADIKRLGAQFDPLCDGYIADPYPHMSKARDLAPVFYSEKLDHWVVTRYHLIRQVFLNPQTSDAHRGRAPPAGRRCDGSPSTPPCRSGSAECWQDGVRADHGTPSAAQR